MHLDAETAETAENYNFRLVTKARSHEELQEEQQTDFRLNSFRMTDRSEQEASILRGMFNNAFVVFGAVLRVVLRAFVPS
jgi:hypothetical protein